MSVFTVEMLRVILGKNTPASLSVLLNRLVQRGVLRNPRRGIYTKLNYNREELACRINTPCYISLEYVLQRAGVVFQYSDAVTCVTYKSTSVEVDGIKYSYRKIKGEIMVDMTGIINNGLYSIATPERAFLDMLYLNSNYTFDNINTLDKEKIIAMLPIYNCRSLENRVLNLFSMSDGCKSA